MIYGFCWSTGVYNAIFLREFKEDKLVTSWAGTLSTASMYAAGPFSSSLTNRYGCRLIIMVGGMIAGIGCCLSYFAPNIYYLYFSFGIVTGIGCGLAFIPVISCVSMYTERYRNVAMGVATCGVGLGTFIYPPFITYLENAYTWRNSLLILGALSFNVIVCGAIIRPISKPCEQKAVKLKTRRVDLRPLRNFYCWLIYINNFFVSFALSIVYVHLVAFMEERGYSEQNSSLVMSAIGGACLVGRVALASIADCQRTNIVWLFLSLFVIGGAAICFIPLHSNTFATIVLESAIFGFFTMSFGSILPGVLIRVLGKDLLATSYGYLLIFSAMGQLLGGPVAGFLYDVTSTYSVSFYVGGAILALSGLALVLVAIRHPGRDARDFEIVLEVEKTDSDDSVLLPSDAGVQKEPFTQIPVVTIDLGELYKAGSFASLKSKIDRQSASLSGSLLSVKKKMDHLKVNHFGSLVSLKDRLDRLKTRDSESTPCLKDEDDSEEDSRPSFQPGERKGRQKLLLSELSTPSWKGVEKASGKIPSDKPHNVPNLRLPIGSRFDAAQRSSWDSSRFSTDQAVPKTNRAPSPLLDRSLPPYRTSDADKTPLMVSPACSETQTNQN